MFYFVHTDKVTTDSSAATAGGELPYNGSETALSRILPLVGERFLASLNPGGGSGRCLCCIIKMQVNKCFVLGEEMIRFETD